MIWHFLEVWTLLAAMFVVGCVLGAFLYGVLAEGSLATAQGVVADSIGDVIDRIKARIGVAPAWRPVHLRSVERPLPAIARREDDDSDIGDEALGGEEPAYVEERKPIQREGPRETKRESRKPVPTVRKSLAKFSEEPVISVGDPRRAASAMAIGADGVVPKRPSGLSAPRGGVPDNFQRIKGIGRRNETILNTIGIYHFGQIAAWTPGEMRWIGQYLAFPERIERDDWVGQAMILAMGSDTGFAKSAERRRARRRQDREFQARMTTATEAPKLAAHEGGQFLSDQSDEENLAASAFDDEAPEEDSEGADSGAPRVEAVEPHDDAFADEAEGEEWVDEGSNESSPDEEPKERF